MVASSDRTLTIGLPPWQQQPLWWPVAQPGDDLDYSLNIGPVLNDVTDSIATLTASLAPSGSGEASLLDAYAQGQVITLQISGGVSCRVYSALIVATMVSGRIYAPPEMPKLLIAQGLLGYPQPVSPSPGYGPAITWTGGASVFAATLTWTAPGIPTGNSQFTAAPVTSQTTVVTTAGSAGAGFILPGGMSGTGPLYVSSGVFNFDNQSTEDFFVYPPVGGMISNAGTLLSANAPVTVAAGQNTNFTTINPQALWFV